MGIEPTREATNPLQTVLKTARHTSTYLPQQSINRISDPLLCVIMSVL